MESYKKEERSRTPSWASHQSGDSTDHKSFTNRESENPCSEYTGTRYNPQRSSKRQPLESCNDLHNFQYSGVDGNQRGGGDAAGDSIDIGYPGITSLIVGDECTNELETLCPTQSNFTANNQVATPHVLKEYSEALVELPSIGHNVEAADEALDSNLPTDEFVINGEEFVTLERQELSPSQHDWSPNEPVATLSNSQKTKKTKLKRDRQSENPCSECTRTRYNSQRSLKRQPLESCNGLHNFQYSGVDGNQRGGGDAASDSIDIGYPGITSLIVGDECPNELETLCPTQSNFTANNQVATPHVLKEYSEALVELPSIGHNVEAADEALDSNLPTDEFVINGEEFVTLERQELSPSQHDWSPNEPVATLSNSQKTKKTKLKRDRESENPCSEYTGTRYNSQRSSEGQPLESCNDLHNFQYSGVDGNQRGGEDAASVNKYYNEGELRTANFQFIVNSNIDRSEFDSPDTQIQWEFVEQVNIQTTEPPDCSICLNPPVAAKISRCNHVFCWHCILQYISFPHMTCRNCPICFTPIDVDDLKSAVIVKQRKINVGDQIIFRLMRRKSNSIFVENISDEAALYSVAWFPLPLSASTPKIFSRYIIANHSDILSIIQREQRELILRDPASPGDVFIKQAINLLARRRQNLEELTANGDEDKQKNDEEIASLMSCNVEEYCYYFYQSYDTQHIYLHPFNIKILESHYTHLANAPLVFQAGVVQLETHSMDEHFRRVFAYLGHLPLTCQFTIVEVNLKPPVVCKNILYKFQGEILYRKERRQQHLRKNVADTNILSADEFPASLPEPSESSKNNTLSVPVQPSVTLERSITYSGASTNKANESPYVSHCEINQLGLEEMLHANKVLPNTEKSAAGLKLSKHKLAIAADSANPQPEKSSQQLPLLDKPTRADSIDIGYPGITSLIVGDECSNELETLLPSQSNFIANNQVATPHVLKEYSEVLVELPSIGHTVEAAVAVDETLNSNQPTDELVIDGDEFLSLECQELSPSQQNWAPNKPATLRNSKKTKKAKLKQDRQLEGSSKRQSLGSCNHLLQFPYSGVAGNQHGGGYDPNKNQYYNHGAFRTANFQFIVNSNIDRSEFDSPDTQIQWEFVEQVNIQTTEPPDCSICLNPPVAAKISRCNHVFCWRCILQYISFPHMTWRNCPICFMPIDLDDLKSVVIVKQRKIKVGDEIIFRLMRRKSNSIFVENISDEAALYSVACFPLPLSASTSNIYSRYIIANRSDILRIIQREQRELILRDPASPGDVFIKQAINLLARRRQNLEELTPNVEDTQEDYAEIDPLMSWDLEEYYYYFYQSYDAQHIYLHPFNIRILQWHYASLPNAPLVFQAGIVELETHSMDENFRSLFAYLGHLPLACQFTIVEVNLKPPVVGMDTLYMFHGEILYRKERRQQHARVEREVGKGKNVAHINLLAADEFSASLPEPSESSRNNTLSVPVQPTVTLEPSITYSGIDIGYPGITSLIVGDECPFQLETLLPSQSNFTANNQVATPYVLNEYSEVLVELPSVAHTVVDETSNSYLPTDEFVINGEEFLSFEYQKLSPSQLNWAPNKPVATLRKSKRSRKNKLRRDRKSERRSKLQSSESCNPQSINQEEFWTPNFQFIVNSNIDRSEFDSPDTQIQWEFVEQVNIQATVTPQCSICLNPPVAAKISRCNHVFCWLCILKYIFNMTWRNCPICSMPIDVDDLKSVVIVKRDKFKIGDEIVFRLMRRKSNSIFVEKMSDEATVYSLAKFSLPPSASASNIYSRYIIVNRSDILRIIEREERELNLGKDPASQEDVFIQQAIDLLTSRRQSLEELTPNIEDEQEDDAEIDPLMNWDVEAYYHYFYQSHDAQHIYLHPFNTRILESHYTHLACAPLVFQSGIVELETHSMDENFRKVFAHLSHLPLTCQFTIVEVNLKPPVVGMDTLYMFHGEIVFRRERRQQRARIEREQEAKINLLSADEFPALGFQSLPEPSESSKNNTLSVPVQPTVTLERSMTYSGIAVTVGFPKKETFHKLLTCGNNNVANVYTADASTSRANESPSVSHCEISELGLEEMLHANKVLPNTEKSGAGLKLSKHKLAIAADSANPPPEKSSQQLPLLDKPTRADSIDIVYTGITSLIVENECPNELENLLPSQSNFTANDQVATPHVLKTDSEVLVEVPSFGHTVEAVVAVDETLDSNQPTDELVINGAEFPSLERQKLSPSQQNWAPNKPVATLSNSKTYCDVLMEPAPKLPAISETLDETVVAGCNLNYTGKDSNLSTKVELPINEDEFPRLKLEEPLPTQSSSTSNEEIATFNPPKTYSKVLAENTVDSTVTAGNSLGRTGKESNLYTELKPAINVDNFQRLEHEEPLHTQSSSSSNDLVATPNRRKTYSEVLSETSVILPAIGNTANSTVATGNNFDRTEKESILYTELKPAINGDNFQSLEHVEPLHTQSSSTCNDVVSTPIRRKTYSEVLAEASVALHAIEDTVNSAGATGNNFDRTEKESILYTELKPAINGDNFQSLEHVEPLHTQSSSTCNDVVATPNRRKTYSEVLAETSVMHPAMEDLTGKEANLSRKGILFINADDFPSLEHEDPLHTQYSSTSNKLVATPNRKTYSEVVAETSVILPTIACTFDSTVAAGNNLDRTGKEHKLSRNVELVINVDEFPSLGEASPTQSCLTANQLIARPKYLKAYSEVLQEPSPVGSGVAVNCTIELKPENSIRPIKSTLDVNAKEFPNLSPDKALLCQSSSSGTLSNSKISQTADNHPISYAEVLLATSNAEISHLAVNHSRTAESSPNPDTCSLKMYRNIDFNNLTEETLKGSNWVTERVAVINPDKIPILSPHKALPYQSSSCDSISNSKISQTADNHPISYAQVLLAKSTPEIPNLAVDHSITAESSPNPDTCSLKMDSYIDCNNFMEETRKGSKRVTECVAVINPDEIPILSSYKALPSQSSSCGSLSNSKISHAADNHPISYAQVLLAQSPPEISNLAVDHSTTVESSANPDISSLKMDRNIECNNIMEETLKGFNRVTERVAVINPDEIPILSPHKALPCQSSSCGSLSNSKISHAAYNHPISYAQVLVAQSPPEISNLVVDHSKTVEYSANPDISSLKMDRNIECNNIMEETLKGSNRVTERVAVINPDEIPILSPHKALPCQSSSCGSLSNSKISHAAYNHPISYAQVLVAQSPPEISNLVVDHSKTVEYSPNPDTCSLKMDGNIECNNFMEETCKGSNWVTECASVINTDEIPILSPHKALPYQSSSSGSFSNSEIPQATSPSEISYLTVDHSITAESSPNPDTCSLKMDSYIDFNNFMDGSNWVTECASVINTDDSPHKALPCQSSSSGSLSNSEIPQATSPSEISNLSVDHSRTAESSRNPDTCSLKMDSYIDFNNFMDGSNWISDCATFINPDEIPVLNPDKALPCQSRSSGSFSNSEIPQATFSSEISNLAVDHSITAESSPNSDTCSLKMDSYIDFNNFMDGSNWITDCATFINPDEIPVLNPDKALPCQSSSSGSFSNSEIPQATSPSQISYLAVDHSITVESSPNSDTCSLKIDGNNDFINYMKIMLQGSNWVTECASVINTDDSPHKALPCQSSSSGSLSNSEIPQATSPSEISNLSVDHSRTAESSPNPDTCSLKMDSYIDFNNFMDGSNWVTECASVINTDDSPHKALPCQSSSSGSLSNSEIPQATSPSEISNLSVDHSRTAESSPNPDTCSLKMDRYIDFNNFMDGSNWITDCATVINPDEIPVLNPDKALPCQSSSSGSFSNSEIPQATSPSEISYLAVDHSITVESSPNSDTCSFKIDGNNDFINYMKIMLQGSNWVTECASVINTDDSPHKALPCQSSSSGSLSNSEIPQAKSPSEISNLSVDHSRTAESSPNPDTCSLKMDRYIDFNNFMDGSNWITECASVINTDEIPILSPHKALPCQSSSSGSLSNSVIPQATSLPDISNLAVDYSRTVESSPNPDTCSLKMDRNIDCNNFMEETRKGSNCVTECASIFNSDEIPILNPDKTLPCQSSSSGSLFNSEIPHAADDHPMSYSKVLLAKTSRELPECGMPLHANVMVDNSMERTCREAVKHFSNLHKTVEPYKTYETLGSSTKVIFKESKRASKDPSDTGIEKEIVRSAPAATFRTNLCESLEKAFSAKNSIRNTADNSGDKKRGKKP